MLMCLQTDVTNRSAKVVSRIEYSVNNFALTTKSELDILLNGIHWDLLDFMVAYLAAIDVLFSPSIERF